MLKKNDKTYSFTLFLTTFRVAVSRFLIIVIKILAEERDHFKW